MFLRPQASRRVFALVDRCSPFMAKFARTNSPTISRIRCSRSWSPASFLGEFPFRPERPASRNWSFQGYTVDVTWWSLQISAIERRPSRTREIMSARCSGEKFEFRGSRTNLRSSPRISVCSRRGGAEHCLPFSVILFSPGRGNCRPSDWCAANRYGRALVAHVKM